MGGICLNIKLLEILSELLLEKLYFIKSQFFWKSLAVEFKKSRNDYFHLIQKTFARSKEIFSEVKGHTYYSQFSLSYNYGNFTIMKKILGQFLEGRLLAKVVFGNVRVDWKSLENSTMVLGLNCKFAQEKCAA